MLIFSSQPFNFELTTVSESSCVANMFFSPFWIFPFNNSLETLFFPFSECGGPININGQVMRGQDKSPSCTHLYYDST